MVPLTEAMRASLGRLWLRPVEPTKLFDFEGELREPFEVPPAGVVIGRDEGADVTIKEPDGYVSRRHLLLIASGVRWTAVDLTSAHGTQLLTVGGASLDLTPEVPVHLAGGDRLRFAEVATIQVEIKVESQKGLPTRSPARDRAGREILRPPLDVLAYELLRPRRESRGSTIVPRAEALAERLNVSERTVYTYRDQLAATRPVARRLTSGKPRWGELADAVAAVYPHLAAPIRERPGD
jgi:FHA domain